MGRWVELLLTRGVMATLMLLLICGAPAPVWAGGPFQLIMVEERGCRFCMRWDEEVGRVYAASPEGKFAPLHRVRRGAPALGVYAPVIYTPTFIVTGNGAEIARITGYPGESYFWEELIQILEPLGLAKEMIKN